MAPNVGRDTYKAYKDGTTKLTSWLVKNALRCKVDIKMKASATSKSKKYAVPLSQFKEMAAAIAQSTNPVIRITPSILSVVRCTIALRKRAASFFAKISPSKRTATSQDSNSGHRYFIKTLEEVLAILDPAKNSIPDDSGTESLSNMFAALNVEEPEVEEVAPQSAARKSKPEPPVEYELETDESEQVFAIFAFFQDINDIRDYVQELWVDYANGKLDVMSAAVTTDTAFHSIKLRCEALAQAPAFIATKQSGIFASMDWDGNPDHLMAVAYLYEYIGGRSEALDEWTCSAMSSRLNAFAEVLHPHEVPALKPDHYGVYRPEADRSKMTKQQRDQEDMIVTMNLLPEFVKLSRAHAIMPVSDELTSGLRIFMDACDAKALPMHSIFAMQILLDVHNALRQHVSRPLTDLQNTARRVVRILDDYFRHSRNKHISTWSPQNDKAFEQIKTLAKDWALNDIMAKFPLQLPQGMRKTESFYLLRNHPVLSGLLAFNLNLSMQEAGIILCNTWGSILYPAHLYNACRHSAGLDVEWPDIEYVIATHSAKRLFVGAAPTEPSDYLKRFVLALGGSAQNFARNRRGGQGLIIQSKKGPRGLKTTTPVRDIFAARYVHGQETFLTKGNITAMLAVVLKAERTSPVSVDLEKLYTQTNAQTDLTHLQLLQVVREGVAAEEMHLLFDYIGLHFRGYKILRTLHTHLQHQLTNFFGSNYIEDESQLPYIVGYVFEIVFGSERASQQLRLQFGGSRSLNTAAETMKGFLEEGRNANESVIAAKGQTNTILYHYFAGTLDSLAAPQ